MVHDGYAPDRVAGVDFGDLDAAPAGHGFPATGRELIGYCGDQRIQHQRGGERFGDLVEPPAGETFDSPGAVHQAVLGVIGEEAVVREGYSDRDPLGRDEPGSEDRSF